MFFTIQDTISLLLTYKYALLFPLSILEGPVVTLLCGFLVSLHLMNWVVVYVIVVVGDVIGDALYYLLGRFGERYVRKFGGRVGITEKRLEFAKKYFDRHHHKTIFTSKIFQGVGVSGLVVAGILKIPYIRYMKTCLVVSCIQVALFLILGVFFGRTYQTLSMYLDYFSALSSVLVLACIVVFLFFKWKNKNTQNTNI